MLQAIRRSTGLILILATLAVSAVWPWSRRAHADPPGAAGDTYAIRFQLKPGRTIYYVVENEFIDGAAISGQIPLAFKDTVSDKRTLIQTVLAPTSRPATQPAGEANGLPRMRWTCDRYEVREHASFRKDVQFDSLRHTYPTSALRQLAQVPGATATFSMDPITGRVSSIRTQPGPTTAPATRQKLSGTAKHCLVNRENVQKLATYLGAFYLPERPQPIGGTWAVTHREPHRSYGTVVTKLTCTLRSVQEEAGSQIATIDLRGEAHIENNPPPSPPPTLHRPGYATPTTRPAPSRSVNPAAIRQANSRLPTSRPTRWSTTLPITTRPVRMDTPLAPDMKPIFRPTSLPADWKTRRTPASRPVRKETPPVRPPIPPARSRRRARADDERRLNRSVCTGTVEFDLTHGEVIEISLHRELEFGKTLKGSKPDQAPTQARQTTSHSLRVKRFLKAPPKPIIQGGPKPPPEPEPTKAAKSRPAPIRHPPLPIRRPPARRAPPNQTGRGPLTNKATPGHPKRRPIGKGLPSTRSGKPLSRKPRARPAGPGAKKKAGRTKLPPPRARLPHRRVPTTRPARLRPPPTSRPRSDPT